MGRTISLDGRVAAVTGAGQGIGRAVAQALAEAGASVLLTDLNEDALETAVRAIRDAGGAAEGLDAEAGRAEAAERLVQVAVERFGRLDIHVNNAAAFTSASVLELTEAEWRRVLAVDLDGVFFHAQAAARQMIAQGEGGRIVNIASQSTIVPPPRLAAYVSAKGGVVAMTRALARELGSHGITANAVSPGTIITEGSQAARARMRALGAYQEESGPPRSVLGRNGAPEEVANAVLFLASDLATYITGEVLAVDGGYALL